MLKFLTVVVLLFAACFAQDYFEPVDSLEEIEALVDVEVDAETESAVAVEPIKNACHRVSNVRGIGKPVHVCPPNTVRSGLLCYPACPQGYKGVGPVCWQKCPSSMKDIGAFCVVRKTWGNNNGCPWYDKCGLVGAKGCVKCPEGMKAHGCRCHAAGSTFAKKTTTRGVGVPLRCARGEEYDAGLCYKGCRAGFDGVGPVCWANCPKDKPHKCLAICTTDRSVCRSHMQNVGKTLLNLVLKLIDCYLENSDKRAGCDPAAIKEDIKVLMRNKGLADCPRTTNTGISTMEFEGPMDLEMEEEEFTDDNFAALDF